MCRKSQDSVYTKIEYKGDWQKIKAQFETRK